MFFSKCENCQKTFGTERGLRHHQSLKKNGNCYRLGILKERENKKSKKQKQKELIRSHNKKILKAEHSTIKLGTKNKSGQTLSADVKNNILYSYDSYIQNGLFPIDVSIYSLSHNKIILLYFNFSLLESQ